MAVPGWRKPNVALDAVEELKEPSASDSPIAHGGPFADTRRRRRVHPWAASGLDVLLRRRRAVGGPSRARSCRGPAARRKTSLEPTRALPERIAEPGYGPPEPHLARDFDTSRDSRDPCL